MYNVPWSSIRKKCLLGQGAFSQVYKVQVELLKAPLNNDNGNNNNNNNDNFSQDESERTSSDNDNDDSESISQSQSQRLVLPTSTYKRSSSSSSLLSLLMRSSSTASLLSLSGSSATGTNSNRKYYAIKHIKTSTLFHELFSSITTIHYEYVYSPIMLDSMRMVHQSFLILDLLVNYIQYTNQKLLVAYGICHLKVV